MTDLQALAQRAAVALETLEKAGRIKSRWLAGMQVWVNTPDGFRLVPFRVRPYSTPKPDWYPDLSDPLTVQALLLLVREASGDVGAIAYQGASRVSGPGGKWRVRLTTSWTAARGVYAVADTEAEALVKALEALAEEVEG